MVFSLNLTKRIESKFYDFNTDESAEWNLTKRIERMLSVQAISFFTIGNLTKRIERFGETEVNRTELSKGISQRELKGIAGVTVLFQCYCC